MHTYHWKHHHGVCEEAFESSWSEVLLQFPGSYTLEQSNPGSTTYFDVELEKGEEVEFNVYTRFSEDDHLPHDWSLTVWSDESPIEITHADGFKSSSFQVQRLREITPIPKDFPEPEQRPDVVFDDEDLEEEFSPSMDEIVRLDALNEIMASGNLFEPKE